MNLETLQQKRAILVAQRDQIMANFNLTNGAVAMIDELIGEELSEQSRAKAAEAEAAASDEKLSAQPEGANFEKNVIKVIKKNRHQNPTAC